MSIRDEFFDLETRALDGPPRQHVHVLGRLLDLARAEGMPADFVRHAHSQGRLGRCARARSGDITLTPLVLGSAFERGSVVRTISCLILLAPVAYSALARLVAERTDLPVEVAIALLGSLPDAPRQGLGRVLLDRAEHTPALRDRTALLIALAPLLSGTTRDRARALCGLHPDPAVRRAVLDALDSLASPEAFHASLSAHARVLAGDGPQWWPTVETRQILSALTETLQRLPAEERGGYLMWAIRGIMQAIERFADASLIASEPAGSPRRPGLAPAAPVPPAALGAQPVPLSHPPIPDALSVPRAVQGAIRPRQPSLPMGPPPIRDRKPVGPVLVSLGIADHASPGTPLAQNRTLAVWRRYYVWVEIGPELQAGSLPGATELPEVPAGSELEVVLFAFPRQIQIDPEYRRGSFQIVADGPAQVTRPAAAPSGLGTLTLRRLFFPVRTPPLPGRYSLRCNIYCRQLLVQSHVLTLEVGYVVRDSANALQRVVDYTLSAMLDAHRLAAVPRHRLSILVNDDGGGTHGFRLVGENDFVADAHIDGATLVGLIDYARGALRRVAWGSTAPWRSADQDPYCYARTPPAAQRAADLVLLARHGYRLWGEALAHFGVRGPKRNQLRALMRAPGLIQLALKHSASHVFPVALVYDHPLDTNLERLTLCPVAAAALEAGADLESEVCFAGSCPSYGDRTVVCPSGFWGFRHELGVPLHLGERGEVATEIPRGANTLVAIGVSTDPDFIARAAHIAALGMLDPQLEIALAEERCACLDALRRRAPHLAYFFCHGGVTASGTPYLEVGARHSEPITADNLLEIWWEQPRPLIVLNGCHTTAASPEQVFSLVTGFVVHANAAGVIGTEITIFEPMAAAFGEELLRRFLGGDPIGRAVRRARLALLRQGNPLGLAYIPFTLATLRLTA